MSKAHQLSRNFVSEDGSIYVHSMNEQLVICRSLDVVIDASITSMIKNESSFLTCSITAGVEQLENIAMFSRY